MAVARTGVAEVNAFTANIPRSYREISVMFLAKFWEGVHHWRKLFWFLEVAGWVEKILIKF